MRKSLVFLLVLLSSTFALADVDDAIKVVFPGISLNTCSPKIIVDQAVADLPGEKILSLIDCDKAGKQLNAVHLGMYEESPAKLISKGKVETEKNQDLIVHAILLNPEKTKISDSDRVFQMRIQYKSLKDSSLTEQLVVLREHGKEISAILKGPIENYPGKGRAFLIITKNKINGYADVAMKSENKTEAFRWRGSSYTSFSKEEIEKLKK